MEDFSQVRLIKEMTRLYERAVDQRCLAGIAQIVGISIIVGRRIFSIVGGLGFEGGLFRGFGQ